MVGQRHQAPVALPLPVGGKADAPARQNRVLGKISCDATGAVVPVVSIAAHRVQRTHRPAQGSELFRDVTAQFNSLHGRTSVSAKLGVALDVIDENSDACVPCRNGG